MGKVALCLSGLSHNLDYYFSITRPGLLDKIKPDVFLAIWENDYTGCWESEHKKAIELFKPLAYHTEVQKTLQDPPRTELCDVFMRSYPRKERWENFAKGYPYPKKIKTYWGRQNCLNMFYMIWKCNQLTKKYGPYDIVIRARIDRGWELNHAPLRQKDNTIFLHSLKDYNALSDWFAYGSAKDMDKYSSVYPNLLKLAEQQENWEVTPDCQQAWYKWLDPHRTLRLHLENEGLKWEIFSRPEVRGHGIVHPTGIVDAILS